MIKSGTMGVLYVVATPIGNLEDITIRAIKMLLTVPVIACEDTRRTGLLIKILDDRRFARGPLAKLVRRRFISVRDWNENMMVRRILEELAVNDVALVSDAGTPLISDPGYKIVRAARSAGFKVVPVPGPSAVTAALSVAGLPTNKFIFLGFGGKKVELLLGYTHVIYESPVRLSKLLKSIEERWPMAEIVIASELTKIHERIGPWVEAGDDKWRGEVTVLVWLPERKVGKEIAADHGNGDGDVEKGEDGGGDVG
ncbi:rRNA small subunit methyltransferase 1 [Candidatus Amesbacteria bacterium]|nr:rRNA small subunit methyltransferase 1 [Candidatus Amesbacteria bacterium]